MCPSYAVVSPTPATTGRSPLCLTLRRVNDHQHHPRCSSGDDNISPQGTQQCNRDLKRSCIINTCRHRVKPYIRLPPAPLLSFHPKTVITSVPTTTAADAVTKAADLVTTSDPVTMSNPVTVSVPVTTSDPTTTKDAVTTALDAVTPDHKYDRTPDPSSTTKSETLQFDDSVDQTDKTKLPRTVSNHESVAEFPRFVGHQINDKLLQNLLYSTSSLHHGTHCEELQETISKYHELTDRLDKLNITKSVLVKEIQTIDTLKERLESKRYRFHEYLAVFLMCTGLVGFSLADQTVSPEFDSKDYDQNLAKKAKNNLHLIQISIEAKGSTKSFTTLTTCTLQRINNASCSPATLHDTLSLVRVKEVVHFAYIFEVFEFSYPFQFLKFFKSTSKTSKTSAGPPSCSGEV
eukprot:sb/3465285/